MATGWAPSSTTRHGFDVDKPGKDSWRHAQAGSDVGGDLWPAQDGPHPPSWTDEMPLDEVVPLMGDVDLVITEGYKRGDKPKIEVTPQGAGDRAAVPGRGTDRHHGRLPGGHAGAAVCPGRRSGRRRSAREHCTCDPLRSRMTHIICRASSGICRTSSGIRRSAKPGCTN